MNAIELDRVTKVFYPLNRHVGLKSMLLRPRSHLQAKRKQALLALDEFSIEIRAGEFFGVLGSNGSGKSTLLGLMAGVLRPTSGEVRVDGKISSLMELGAGLEPQLSGRENIILNGVLLGMRRAEVESKFDEILEFSGLGSFVEQPVFTYSAGMQMRLAFSVAIHTNPRILLVDEVLAVGDEAFQRRCFERIASLRRDGVTIVLVSHNLDVIENHCDRAAWIDSGKLVGVGAPVDLIRQYREKLQSDRATGQRPGDVTWRSAKNEGDTGN